MCVVVSMSEAHVNGCSEMDGGKVGDCASLLVNSPTPGCIKHSALLDTF